MTENMMQEIIDNWNSWKYDIIDCNTSIGAKSVLHTSILILLYGSCLYCR